MPGQRTDYMEVVGGATGTCIPGIATGKTATGSRTCDVISVVFRRISVLIMTTRAVLVGYRAESAFGVSFVELAIED